jgi:hypothetical protein
MSGTPQAIQSAVDRLQKALQEIGTSMYQQQQQPPPGDSPSGEEPSETTSDEDVIEGEFSED